MRQALKRDGNGRNYLGEPKTSTSRRTLDLPAPVVASLRSHRARQAAERQAAGSAWEDTGLVFTTEVGTMLGPRNTRRYLSKLTQAAKLGHWRPHELRHSTVSLLSAAGVPLEDVADVVGHATTRVTSEVYRHPVRLRSTRQWQR